MYIAYWKERLPVKIHFLFFISERRGFEPLVRLLVRFISNEVLSATQSSLQIVKGIYRTKFYCLHVDFWITRPVGLEPTTSGFGDLRSTNWTKDALKSKEIYGILAHWFVSSSEWQDSNLRPHRPKRRTLPNCATLRYALMDRVPNLTCLNNGLFSL